MKANELRLGNYIWHTNNNGTFKVQVVGITPKGIKVKYLAGIWTLAPNELSPIPLTEELLLKCGAILFESTYDGWHFYHLKHFVFDGRKGKVCFGAFDRDCEGHNNDFEIEIEHLHQLQNLYFALTGEELDIELL